MRICYRKNGRSRRGLSAILALTMVLSLPLQSMAAIAQTKDNSRRDNEEILENLKKIEGERASGVLEQLKSMGLVAPDGSLVTRSINVDGEEKSLQQVFAMVNAGADLSQKISVDGTELTLGDLKVMAEIEEELSRIEKTYFKEDITLTEEQKASLASLKAQLGNSGMDITGFADVQMPEPEFSLGIQHDAVVAMSISGGSGTTLADGSYQVPNQTGTIQVNLELNKALDYEVSVKLRVLAGSAAAGQVVTALDQTVSFPRNVKTQSVSVNLKKADMSLKESNDVWSGDRVFVVQAYGPEKILFEGQKTVLNQVVRVLGDGKLTGWIPEGTVLVDTGVFGGTTKKEHFNMSRSFGEIDNYLKQKNAYVLKHRWWVMDGDRYSSFVNSIVNDADHFSRLDATSPQSSSPRYHIDGKTENIRSILTGTEETKALYGNQICSLGAESIVEPGFPNDWGGYHPDDIAALFSEDFGINILKLNPRGTQEPSGYIGGGNYPRYDVYGAYVSSCNMKGMNISNGFNISNRRVRTDVLHFDSYNTSGSEYYNFYLLHTPKLTTDWEKRASKMRTTLTLESENPSVIAVSAPAGTYTTGQILPITVQFNMPVQQGISLTFGNQRIISAEQNCIGDKLTFLYEVRQGETKAPKLTAVNSSIKIYSGKEKGVSIKSGAGELPDNVRVDAAVTDLDAFRACSVSAEKASYGPSDQSAGIYVALPKDKELAQLLTGSAHPEADGSFTSTKLEVCTVYGNYKLTFVDKDGNPTETGAVGMKAEIPLDYNVTAADRCIGVELGSIAASSSDPAPVIGQYIAFLHAPAVPMRGENLTVQYPEGFPRYDGTEKSTIYRDSDSWPTAEQVRLSWNHDNQAAYTWPADVSWSSSAPSVAAIDERTGQITFTGSAGEVTFTLTAQNGGKYDTGAAYQKTTDPIKIGVGYRPYLEIPDTINPISIRSGQTARVKWSTNLFDKNAEASGNADVETQVVVTLYKAEYDTQGNLQEVSADKQVGDPLVLTGTAKSPVYTCEFENLNEVSEGKRHSYVAVVSIEAHEDVPMDTGSSRTFQEKAFIDIVSRKVGVKLSKPEEGLYLTSSQNVTVQWELTDFDQKNGAAFRLKVVNNDTKEVFIDQTNQDGSTIAASGTVTLPVDVNNGYCEAYTIEVSAKNQAEESWSRDGYLYRVYDQESLQLVIDGLEEQADGTYLLSNREEYKNAKMADILAKNRQIFLQGDVSINADDHSWKDLSDPMKWSLKDEKSGGKSAALNYFSFGEYRDVKKLNYETYVPADTFLLSGRSDGETTLGVEHGFLPALRKEAGIEVQTMKDRLYLFQFRPAVKTEITYTDSNGDEQTVESDDRGRAAIYEDGGIHSNLYLKSEYANDTYLGTIYPDTLVSSEQDAASLELYPLNNMNLKKVASIPVYLKNPDGTPYTGKVKVYGGVIQNGQYCERAELDKKDGAEGFSITPGDDGSHTFKLDLTQFNSEVRPQDNLEFIFQLEFPDGKYYPMYLSVDGNMNNDDEVRAAERVLSLTQTTETDKEKPFTSLKRLYFAETASGLYKDVKDTRVKLGPGASCPAVTLETYAIWWGENPEGETQTQSLQYTNSKGVVLSFQESEKLDYPFLPYPVVKNVMHLDQAAMDELNITAYESMGVNLKYKSGENDVPRQESGIFRIVNMLDTEKVSDSEALTIALTEMMKAGTITGEGQKFGDSLIAGGIMLMSAVDTKVGSPSLRLSPTEDPTVFKGFISLGLGNIEEDNTSGFDTSVEDRNQDVDYLPGLSDIKNMYDSGLGGYAKESKNLLKYAGAFIKETGRRGMANGVAGNAANTQNNVGYELSGYFESIVFYDHEAGSWRIQVLNGGFTAGGGFGKSWTWNASVGPVPVLAQLAFGAGTVVDFNAAVNHETNVNDYMTYIRIMAYIRAFGGIGFDYEVVALKVGLYGQINADMRLSFLNRQGGDPDVGFTISGDGEVGVEFLVKLLFISYERIFWGKKFDFGTYETDTWKTNEEYWESVKSGKADGIYESLKPDGGARAASLVMADPDAGISIYSASDVARLESRDYLNNYERSWNEGEEKGFLDKAASGVQSLMRRNNYLASTFDLKEPSEAIMDNAYPYAAPAFAEDGKKLFYLTDQGDAADVSKTRVAVSTLGANGYNEGTILSDQGYGDSQLKAAGAIASGQDYSAAVYTRVSSLIKKEPGSEITADEQEQMMSSTEIMCSHWDNEEKDWVTTQLTDNAYADMAPAIAVYGENIFVAWRRTAGSDSSDLVNFDEKDEILYRIYNGKEWSEEQTLYNGTGGTVSGLDASMAQGRAAVTYTLNTDTESNQSAAVDPKTGEIISGAEVYYAVIDTATQEMIRCTGVTADKYLDENPQITRVKRNGKDRFIVGWHTVRGGGSLQTEDIRLLAFDADGNVIADFPDSVARITDASRTSVSGNFRFAKGAQTLDQLSLVWKEASLGTEQTEEDEGVPAADKDQLRAMRFTTQGGAISMTAPQIIGAMEDSMAIDSFDTYIKDSGNTVQAVLLRTFYDSQNLREVPVVYDGITREGTDTVVLPSPTSSIFETGGSYEDLFCLDYILPDYSSIARGVEIPVQLGITNRGTQPIKKLTVEIGKQTTECTDANGFRPLAPGESRQITAWYQIDDSQIVNPQYSVKAVWKNDKQTALDPTTEAPMVLVLDVADVGISEFAVREERDGERLLQIVLCNSSDVKLADSAKKQTVKAGLYLDAACTRPVPSEYLTEVTNRSGDGVIKSISDTDGLKMVDNGNYVIQYRFDMKSFIEQQERVDNGTVNYPYASADGEIRESGIQLYARTWLSAQDENHEEQELSEFNIGNNIRSVTMESLLHKSDGEPVSLKLGLNSLKETDYHTNVSVEVQNNSIKEEEHGNLIVSLLDDKGNVIEVQQLYNAEKEDKGLLVLDGEENSVCNFKFKQAGAMALAEFTNSIFDDKVELADITLQGTNVALDQFKPVTGASDTWSMTVETENFGNTSLLVRSNNVNAVVLADGRRPVTDAGNQTVTQNLLVQTVELTPGKTKQVVITVAGGVTTKKYILNVINRDTGEVASQQSEGEGGSDR